MKHFLTNFLRMGSTVSTPPIRSAMRSILLVLGLLLGSLSMWGETITLDRSNVAGKTSYNTSEQTFTQSVSFGYINLMDNGSNGTPSNWAKNQVMQTKSGGFLYNKGALNTIQTIKIWIVANDNSFTIGYGNTEKPTTNTIQKTSATKTTPNITYTKYANKTTTANQTTTANMYEFDLSSYNASHFCIIPGGSLYIWKVEIIYEESGTGEPTVSAGPVGATYGVDDVATPLNVTATASSGSLSYAWYSNSSESTEGATKVAETETYTPSTSAAGTMYYFCVVTDDNGSATSAIAAVEVKAKHTVTWKVNGENYSEGTPSSTVLDGATIAVFPTAPSSCDAAKEFVGWTATEIGVTPTDTKPTFVSPQTEVTGDLELHAVFAAKTANSYTLGDINDLIDGKKVIIYNSNQQRAMSNSNATNGTGKLDGLEVSLSENVISAPDESLIWNVYNDGIKYQFKSGSNFLRATQNANTKLECGATADSWTINAQGSNYTMYSNNSTASFGLEAYTQSSKYFFTTYSANTTANYQMQFYVPTYSGYVTKCCTKYSISLAGDPAGTVTGGTFSADVSAVCEGTTVTITAVPGSAFTFGNITVVETADPANAIAEEDIAVVENVAVFEMPAYPVTVTANFNPKPCTKLDDPANIVVTGGDYPYNAVNVAWDEVEHAEKYEIEILNGETSVESDNVEAPAHAYVIKATLLANTTYTYKIRAMVDTEGTYCNSDVAEGAFTTSAYPTVEVTYSENGNSVSGGTKAIMTPFALPTEVSHECTKTFVGWTSKSDFANGDESLPSYYEKGAEFTINSNEAVTLYAVYADVTPGTPSNIFTEGFDDCNGSGGNDDKWSGSIASAELASNFNDWSLENQYAAKGCVRLGKSSGGLGSAQTPAITLTGSATLTFRAGAWNGNSENTNLKLSATGATLDKSSVTMEKGSFTEYTVAITNATGSVNIKFEGNAQSNSRFFLDDVVVSQTSVIKSNYATTCSAQLSTPEFSGATDGETYDENKNITITAEDEATIYYTTNGDDPTDESTVYADPISVTTNGEHIIKAFARKTGYVDSEIATITFTINKPCTSIKELIDSNPTVGDSKVLTFTNESAAIITGVNGSNRYVQDASGYGIVIRSSNWDEAAIVGKQIKAATITGTWDVYNGQMQLKDATFSDVTLADADLPAAVTISGDAATAFAAHPTVIVKLENMKFQQEFLESRAVDIKDASENTYTLFDQFNKLTDKDMPLNSTDCDVTGILVRFTSGTTKYEILPLDANAISTKGAMAVLPTISDAGGASTGEALEVAKGKNIVLSVNTDFDAVYQVNDGAETAVGANTTVPINDTENATKLYVKASRDFYTDNEITYYYIANESLTEHTVACATGLTGGSIEADKASAAAGATVTLTAHPAEHFTFGSWSVTYNDGEEKSVAVDGNTFEMPAYAVMVSATFNENDYAMVTFEANGATSGTMENQKVYVGESLTLPTCDFVKSGNTFSGWKIGGVDYAVNSTYDVTSTAPITVTAQWDPYPWGGNGKWELVTDASELTTSPSMYIIFGKNNKAAGAQNTNYREIVDVTIANGLLTWTETEPAVFTLETNAANTFAIADAANGGYLNANGTGNNNYLTTTPSKESDNASWEIVSINAETGEAVIKAKSNNRNMLSINTQNSRFSAYSQAQAGLQVFKFVAGSYFNINYAKGVDEEEEENVTNMPVTQVTASDGTATLSDKTPIYVGHIFDGWKLDVNTTYQPSDEVGPLSQNITLTAQWSTAQQHTLSYEKNGGEGDIPDATNYYPNADVTLADAITKEGYIFAGWEYDGNVYAAGTQFTMPNVAVVMTAKFAQGAVYTITSRESVSAQGAPEGSNATFVNTYNNDKCQLTSGNSMTLTLSGYDLYTIKALTLRMKSNASSGKGALSVTIGGNAVSFTTNKWYDGTHNSGSYEDIQVMLTPTRVMPGEIVEIVISASQNSLYCQSFAVEYERVLDEIRGELFEGKWGTICPKQEVKYPAGAAFYQLTYMELNTDGSPYKFFFDEIAENASLEAGKPYLFIADGEVIKGVKVGDTKADGDYAYNGFVGYIGEGKHISSDNDVYTEGATNYYGLQNNVFKLIYSTSSTNNILDERAYVEISPTRKPSTTALPMPAYSKRRLVVGAGAPAVTTGMDELNASEAPVKVMIDGQLFIIRGEKMYNANGQLVK